MYPIITTNAWNDDSSPINNPTSVSVYMYNITFIIIICILISFCCEQKVGAVVRKQWAEHAATYTQANIQHLIIIIIVNIILVILNKFMIAFWYCVTKWATIKHCVASRRTAFSPFCLWFDERIQFFLHLTIWQRGIASAHMHAYRYMNEWMNVVVVACLNWNGGHGSGKKKIWKTFLHTIAPCYIVIYMIISWPTVDLPIVGWLPVKYRMMMMIRKFAERLRRYFFIRHPSLFRFWFDGDFQAKANFQRSLLVCQPASFICNELLRLVLHTNNAKNNDVIVAHSL